MSNLIRMLQKKGAAVYDMHTKKPILGQSGRTLIKKELRKKTDAFDMLNLFVICQIRGTPCQLPWLGGLPRDGQLQEKDP